MYAKNVEECRLRNGDFLAGYKNFMLEQGIFMNTFVTRTKQNIFLSILFGITILLVLWMGQKSGKAAVRAHTWQDRVVLSQKTDRTSMEEFVIAKKEEQQNPNPIVYLTISGQKYHSFVHCSFLKQSASVQGVLLSEAMKLEKSECSFCKKHRESMS